MQVLFTSKKVVLCVNNKNEMNIIGYVFRYVHGGHGFVLPVWVLILDVLRATMEKDRCPIFSLFCMSHAGNLVKTRSVSGGHDTYLSV